MSQPTYVWPSLTPAPLPFDASTFDPDTLSDDFIRLASQDPDLCLVWHKPDPLLATSAWDFVRRETAVEVSRSVLDLGKDPYPGLKQHHTMPDWNLTTPEYDYTRPWFGDSVVLKYLTPAKLEELGCINIGTGMFSPISYQYRIDTDVAARASKLRTAPKLYVGNHDGIHPLVRRNKFFLTSDYEYECLKPTLRIITKLLETESVLDILWAIGQPWTQVQGTKMLKDVYVYHTGRSTSQQRSDTALELIQLADYVHFEWGDTSTWDEANAVTIPLSGKPGLRGGTTTFACKIGIDNSFRYAIVDGSAVLADLYNPEATNASSFLRTQLWLAIIIVHELSHAFRQNTNKLPSMAIPFCNDNRTAEEGYALEAAVHRGEIMEPNDANVALVTSRFGMKACEWPGITHRANKTRRTYQEDGIVYTTSDMIKMEYIRDFFCDDYWDQRHLRYGTGMSNFKAVGVRRIVQDDTTAQQRRHDTLESVKWMSDVVEEGIVYEDRLVDLSGEKVIATKAKTLLEQVLEDIAQGSVVKDVKKLSNGMKALVGKSPIQKKKTKKTKKWSKKS